MKVPMLKTCSRCGVQKDIERFLKRGDGRRGTCKDCEADRSRARAQAGERVVRDTSTQDNVQFWERAQHSAEQIKNWPVWKKTGLEDVQVRPSPREDIAVDVYLEDPIEGPTVLSEPQRILFVPDTHRPYHDKKKWALMLRAARIFKPDIIVIGGDFADCYSVSDHSKDPSRARLLQDELADVNEGLSELDALGATRKIYVSGNHEDRLDRYIANRAPEFYGMVCLRDLLKLKERGWEWVQYKESTQLGKLHITHDCGKAGKYAHYDAQSAFEGNAVIFHTHRIGYAVVGNAEGAPHVGCMLGWLGDLDTVDYMHRIRARRDWAHGFGIGYLMPDGCVHISPVPIVRDSVIIEGKVVT